MVSNIDWAMKNSGKRFTIMINYNKKEHYFPLSVQHPIVFNVSLCIVFLCECLSILCTSLKLTLLVERNTFFTERNRAWLRLIIWDQTPRRLFLLYFFRIFLTSGIEHCHLAILWIWDGYNCWLWSNTFGERSAILHGVRNTHWLNVHLDFASCFLLLI